MQSERIVAQPSVDPRYAAVASRPGGSFLIQREKPGDDLVIGEVNGPAAGSSNGHGLQTKSPAGGRGFVCRQGARRRYFEASVVLTMPSTSFSVMTMLWWVLACSMTTAMTSFLS